MLRLAFLAVVLAGCGGEPTMPGPGASGGAGATPEEPQAGQAAPGPSASPSPSPSAAPDPCAMASLGDGAYCGKTLGGDPNALYDCAGGLTAKKTDCAMGCHLAPPGVADYCEDGGLYHLPWACGVTYPTTQGNHGDICGSNGGDHTGTQEYAWDFGIPRHTAILAARAGTVTLAANVTGPGKACYDGCTQPFGSSAFWACCNGCINTANRVNVQHADGTVATYWHLDEATVKVGDHVEAGQALGWSGTSGCSSGPHLHFQVMGSCPTSYCQSIAVDFSTVGAPACGASVRSDNGC